MVILLLVAKSSLFKGICISHFCVQSSLSPLQLPIFVLAFSLNPLPFYLHPLSFHLKLIGFRFESETCIVDLPLSCLGCSLSVHVTGSGWGDRAVASRA